VEVADAVGQEAEVLRLGRFAGAEDHEFDIFQVPF
jgi:hypothetical protein